MTKNALTREYIAVHGVPVALLLTSIITPLFLPNMYQLAVPLVALGAGIVTRPRSVPIVWAALYLPLFLASVGALALGRELPKMPDDNQGLAPANLFFIALLLFVYLAVMVLPLLWIGRWLGHEIMQHRRPGSSPA